MATIGLRPNRPSDGHAGPDRAGWPPTGLLLAAGLLLAGCATSGPNHVYTSSADRPGLIHDSGPDGVVDVPSFTDVEDGLTGLAYDPFTDHLFLRLAPGNRIRVIDRPDRSIKREFTIPELPATGGGDLATRPRDGHLFFLIPGNNAVIETDRFGKFVRRLELEGPDGGASGLAYDAERNRLLVATTGLRQELHIHDLNGKLLHSSVLDCPRVRSLACDDASRELHATIPDEAAIVVLNEDGRILRRVPAPESVEFIDLGQRSFVRVF